MSSGNRIYTIVELSGEILVSEGVLGESFNIKVRERDATLVMPKMPDGNNFTAQTVLVQPLDSEYLSKHKDWGYYDGNPFKTCYIRRILISIDYESEICMDNDGSLLTTDLHNWIATWRTSLKQFGYGSFTTKVQSSWEHTSKDIISIEIESDYRDAHEIQSLKQRWNHDVRRTAGRLINKAEIAKSIEYISYPNSIKLEFIYIHNAIESIQHGDYRTAVIDANTAFEISIKNAITERWNEEQFISIENVLKRHGRQIGELVKLAKRIGINIPDADYQTTLFDLRNEIVHRGTLVSSDAALTAVKLAHAAVYSISGDPLSVLWNDLK